MKNARKVKAISLLLAGALAFPGSGCGTAKRLENSEASTDQILESESEANNNSVFEESEEDEGKNLEEARKAEAEAQKASEEAKKAEEERLKAEEESKKAEEERLKAEAEAKKAEEERLKAEAEAKKAEEERRLAEIQEEKENELTQTQATSISMLNYMTVLTQQINSSSGNQMFLEAARTSLHNDTNLNAVDRKTQDQINQLVDTIDQYRMVDVKRERLQFIFEQNQAQAMRQAMPNPMGLLSAVQSGSLLKAAASVLYMAVDSATSYKAATNQAELAFIKEGWELDDEEIKILQNSTNQQFNYMCNMVRDYDLPDEYIVRDTDVKTFVEWSNKTNLTQKIDWLKANESTYKKFGPYWLELAKDYYNSGEYKDCLNAVTQYEAISAKITRKDRDYANTLPMAIIAAKETMQGNDYVKLAKRYCEAIRDNTKDQDWALRYFAAQTYVDLYGQTKRDEYLQRAYEITYYNVTTLVDEQRALNKAYIEPIKEKTAEKGATKRVKKEIKQYNELLKNERKVAVPPVSEALYLNCDLLFAVAEKRGITKAEWARIDKNLHENGEDLFLTKALENKFRKNVSPIDAKNTDVLFDGKMLSIPVTCISDRSQVVVKINGGDSAILDDWKITEVTRPKNANYSEFKVKYSSTKGKNYKYKAGDKITISVIPIIESPEEVIEFTYEVVATKTAFVFDGIAFERR